MVKDEEASEKFEKFVEEQKGVKITVQVFGHETSKVIKTEFLEKLKAKGNRTDVEYLGVVAERLYYQSLDKHEVFLGKH